VYQTETGRKSAVWFRTGDPETPVPDRSALADQVRIIKANNNQLKHKIFFPLINLTPYLITAIN
jgi:hypothetical protein